MHCFFFGHSYQIATRYAPNGDPYEFAVCEKCLDKHAVVDPLATDADALKYRKVQKVS